MVGDAGKEDDGQGEGEGGGLHAVLVKGANFGYCHHIFHIFRGDLSWYYRNLKLAVEGSRDISVDNVTVFQ